jgi:hypothetical protein
MSTKVNSAAHLTRGEFGYIVTEFCWQEKTVTLCSPTKWLALIETEVFLQQSIVIYSILLILRIVSQPSILRSSIGNSVARTLKKRQKCSYSKHTQQCGLYLHHDPVVREYYTVHS